MNWLGWKLNDGLDLDYLLIKWFVLYSYGLLKVLTWYQNQQFCQLGARMAWCMIYWWSIYSCVYLKRCIIFSWCQCAEYFTTSHFTKSRTSHLIWLVFAQWVTRYLLWIWICSICLIWTKREKKTKVMNCGFECITSHVCLHTSTLQKSDMVFTSVVIQNILGCIEIPLTYSVMCFVMSSHFISNAFVCLNFQIAIVGVHRYWYSGWIPC